MAEVTVRDLKKSYDELQVLHGLDIDINDGEFVVLVGPSGCGKSTLLRMIAGLESISGGAIHINERLVNNLPPAQRDIAMVFQNYALYPHKTVRGNISFSLRMKGLSKNDIKDKVQKAAEILGLIPYSSTLTAYIVITLCLSIMVMFACTFYAFQVHGSDFIGFFLPSGCPG